MRPPERQKEADPSNTYAPGNETKATAAAESKQPHQKRKPLTRLATQPLKPPVQLRSPAQTCPVSPPVRNSSLNIAYEDVLDDDEPQNLPAHSNVKRQISLQSYNVLHHQTSREQLVKHSKVSPTSQQQQQQQPLHHYHDVGGYEEAYAKLANFQPSGTRPPYDKMHASPPPYQLPADAIRLGAQEGNIVGNLCQQVPVEFFGSQETLLDGDYQLPTDAIRHIRSDSIECKTLCYVCTQMQKEKEECTANSGNHLKSQPAFTSTASMRVEGRCTCKFDATQALRGAQLPPYNNILGAVRGEEPAKSGPEEGVMHISDMRSTPKTSRKSKEKSTVEQEKGK